MIIRRLDDIEQAEVSHHASIKKRVMLGQGELSGLIQFARSVFPPGAVAGEHRHEDMAELFWVESGRGQLAAEGREDTLTSDTCVLVDVGEAHELRNSGERDLGCVGKLDLASSGSFSAWLHPAVSTIEPTSPASLSLPGEKTARSRADDGVFRQSLVLTSFGMKMA